MSHRFDWLAEYLHETTDFPEGKHDDQADSTAQFLDWFKTPIACWGIYETTRRKAVKAPAGIGAVQTFLKPAYHRRLGRHRRDVRGGCRVFDPCWLDRAPRWNCDVARRPGHRQSGPEVLRTPC